MAIDLEKVLTMSVGDYLEFHDLNPNDYVAIGVHVDVKNAGHEAFAKKVPDGTEAVLDYQQTTGGAGSRYSSAIIWYTASGTALIPKGLYNPLKDQ